MKKARRGQSFVEYLILIGTVLAVIVAVAEGPIHDGVKKLFEESAEGVKNIANKAN